MDTRRPSGKPELLTCTAWKCLALGWFWSVPYPLHRAFTPWFRLSSRFLCITSVQMNLRNRYHGGRGVIYASHVAQPWGTSTTYSHRWENRLLRLVRLQTDNFRLLLYQQTDKRQTSFCTMSSGNVLRKIAWASLSCLKRQLNIHTHTCGKRQFPFVWCRRKTVTTNCHLFAATGNGKRRFVPWSANDQR